MFKSEQDFSSKEYLRGGNRSNLSDSDDLSSINSFISLTSSQTSFCETGRTIATLDKIKKGVMSRQEEVSKLRNSMDKLKIHEDIHCEHKEEEEGSDGGSSKSDGDSFEGDDDDIESSKNLSIKESIPPKDPTFVPRHSGYFLHDDRLGDEIENETPTEWHKSPSKLDKRWEHDLFDSYQQVPKSKEELIEIYGYDIRTKDETSLELKSEVDNFGKDSGKRNVSISKANSDSTNRNQYNYLKDKRLPKQYKQNKRYNNVSIKQNKFDDCHGIPQKGRIKRSTSFEGQVECEDKNNNLSEYTSRCCDSLPKVSGVFKNVPTNLNLRRPRFSADKEKFEVIKRNMLSENFKQHNAGIEEKKAALETKYFYNKHIELNDFQEKDLLRNVQKATKIVENQQERIPLTYEQFLREMKFEWDKEQQSEDCFEEVARDTNFQSESYEHCTSEIVHCVNNDPVDSYYGKETEEMYVNENCSSYEKPVPPLVFSGYVADNRLVGQPNFDNFSSLNPPLPQCYPEFIEVEQPSPTSYIYPYQQVAFFEPREAATPVDLPFFYFLEQPQSQHYFTPQRPTYRPVGIGRGRIRSPLTSPNLYPEPEFVHPSYDITPAPQFDIAKHSSYSTDYVQQRFVQPLKEIETSQRYWAFRDYNQNDASGFIVDVCNQPQSPQQPDLTVINISPQALRQEQNCNIKIEDFTAKINKSPQVSRQEQNSNTYVEDVTVKINKSHQASRQEQNGTSKIRDFTAKINKSPQVSRQEKNSNTYVEEFSKHQTFNPSKKFLSRYCKQITYSSDKSDEVHEDDDTNKLSLRRPNPKRYSIQRLTHVKPSDP